MNPLVVVISIIVVGVAWVGFLSFTLWQFRNNLKVGQKVTVQGEYTFYEAVITYLDKDSVRVITGNGKGYIVSRKDIFN